LGVSNFVSAPFSTPKLAAFHDIRTKISKKIHMNLESGQKEIETGQEGNQLVVSSRLKHISQNGNLPH